MAKDSNRQRTVIAQQAARLMAEEGIADYAFAKRKAARQLGLADTHSLPGNAEIEIALREYQELYLADEQPQQLKLLREDALVVMRLLQRFDPHLTGAVLDGTAGRYAQTEIHLFADSGKEVEIFLLNNKIPYHNEEHSHHNGGDRRKTPVLVIDGLHGAIRLSVFSTEERRISTKNVGRSSQRATTSTVENLLTQA